MKILKIKLRIYKKIIKILKKNYKIEFLFQKLILIL
jgi:hypothetical protein